VAGTPDRAVPPSAENETKTRTCPLTYVLFPDRPGPVNSPAALLDLAVCLVTLPGGRSAVADGNGAQSLRIPDARDLRDRGPVIVAHAGMTAKRLGLNTLAPFVPAVRCP